MDRTFVQARDLATDPHCVRGGDEYIAKLVAMSVHINQLHTMLTVIFA